MRHKVPDKFPNIKSATCYDSVLVVQDYPLEVPWRFSLCLKGLLIFVTRFVRTGINLFL